MKYVRISLVILVLAIALAASACQALDSPLEDRAWVLQSFTRNNETHTPVEGTEVTIFFDSASGEMSGSGGCNHYGGPYEVKKLNLTITGPVYRTEMWCGEEVGAVEDAYLEAIQAAAEFRVGKSTLTITGGGWTIEYREIPME